MALKAAEVEECEQHSLLSGDSLSSRSPATRWRQLKPVAHHEHSSLFLPTNGDANGSIPICARDTNGKAQRGRRFHRLCSAMLSNEQFLGLFSMFLLVFQGTALSLTLRYSRTNIQDPYLPSAAVIFTELIKLAICVFAQLAVCRREATAKCEPFRTEFNRQYHDITFKSVPLLVPAALFVLQQVLVIVAASHLDAIMFQIFSQSFKIIPTALFAVWLLGQTLSPTQWGSLPVLVIGVVLVTMNKSEGSGGTVENGNWTIGMLASSLSGLSSAYAGVYFEKYVKGKQSASLWVRNLQLSLYGVPLSVAYALLKDNYAIRQRGIFQGFNSITWGVILLQVFGGLIVGMVVKYADNILKNFANAISVILTVLLAIPLFGLWPSFNFLLGVAVVLFSVFLYGNSVRVESKSLLRAFDSLNRRRKAFMRRTGLLNENGDCCLNLSFVLLVTLAAGAVVILGALATMPDARRPTDHPRRLMPGAV